MSDNSKRQPRGIPTGGEFAANEHDEALGSLGSGAADPYDIDFTNAQDIDDPDTLSAVQRARLGAIEDVMLARPHPVQMEDGSTALFWHERRGENERDRRPDRDARAIMDTEGNISDFQTSIDHGDWEPDDEMTNRLNATEMRESRLPTPPSLGTDEQGREVYTGGSYREGASASEIGNSMRKTVAAAVKDGTLPSEFTYNLRATDLDGNRMVSCVTDISGWAHGGNHGLTPGQTVYDMSPQVAAKVQRAERVLEKLFESHDRKTIVDETTSLHAYTWMQSTR